MQVSKCPRINGTDIFSLKVNEDGSSSSSGSSSGYGSQNAIKIEDKNGKVSGFFPHACVVLSFVFSLPVLFDVGLTSRIDCCTTNNNYNPHHFSKFNYNTSERSSLRRPSFTLQLQHRPIVENIISDNNTYRPEPPNFNFNTTNRRAFTLKRSDSYSPGRLLNFFHEFFFVSFCW